MPNTVVLGGNVVADPQLHDTGTTKICKFNLANERRFGKASRTAFVPIITFGKTAELCAEYVKKGSPITITGNLNQENWKDKKDGSNRSRLSVIANEWEFNGPKPADQDSSGGQAKPQESSAPQGGSGVNPEDIPF